MKSIVHTTASEEIGIIKRKERNHLRHLHNYWLSKRWMKVQSAMKIQQIKEKHIGCQKEKIKISRVKLKECKKINIDRETVNIKNHTIMK